jgi:hypothetical protein
MEETPLYQEDWLGLKELNSTGRLVLDHAPGFHMQFTLEWFGREVVRAHLAVEEGLSRGGGGGGDNRNDAAAFWIER